MHKQTKRWISTMLAVLMLCSTVFSNMSLVHASEFSRPISTTGQADSKQPAANEQSNAPANAPSDNSSAQSDTNVTTPLNFNNLVLQAKVEDNNLKIFSASPDAKEFFAKVKTVHVNEVRFDPIKEFDVEENEIVFSGNPARFMKNEIKVTLEDGDEKDFIFENPNGKPFNHGLQIVSVELDKQGDPAAGFVSEYVKMSLDSEYATKELHATIRRLKSVSIDDLDYPMRDDKGMIVFILSNGALGIYDQYPVGKAAVADFKLRDKHKVVFTFEDDSTTVYEDTGYVKPDRGNTPPPPPKVGIAKEYDIKEVKTKKGWGDEELLVTFDKKLSIEHAKGVKNIKVNGKDFGRPADLGINFDGELRTANAQVVTHAKTKTPIEFEVTFGDDSVLVYVPSVPSPDDLNLDSDFKDGAYTLTLKNYKVGSSEKSDYDNILDSRAKLYVANGKKTISFLLHTDAKDYADFAIKAQSDFESMHPVVLKSDGNGDPIAVEYLVDMKDLKGKKLSALLSLADEAKKGKFDDPSYKRFEIEFDNKVTKGFSNYKFFDAPPPTGDAALIKALIANGLDTDNDKKISIDELKNAVGKDKQPDIDIPGYPGKNTLNLGSYGISDISLLKHLGPNIKAINLDSNKLTALPADVFQNATGLSHIILSGNKIQKIEPNTFDSLSALKYIDFDGSLLEELPKGIFDKNKDLKVLSLMNNKLESLPDDLLKNNTKLEELYLFDNALSELSDDFFATNKELKALHIFNNRLESLPSSLSAATKIKVITAQGNKIKEIPSSWGKLRQIERLDLENNRIESIPAKLLSNMIAYAKYTPTVSLDLTQNNLKTLPIDEMTQALVNGKPLTKFEVNLNMLPEKPSADDINKMKKLGIEFEKAVDIYYPQKTSMQSIAKGENKKIELNQGLSVLELLYWDSGDSPRYGGKAEFSDRDEFIKYMTETGRDVNGVERSLSREDGIKAILEKKNLQWEVETKIIKNDTEKVYSKREKGNPKDALKQTFDEPNMADGDKYKIYKTMYLKIFDDFTVKLEKITEFTAGQSGPQPPTERKVPAKLLTADGKEFSFANDSLKSVHVKTLDKKSPIKMAEFTFEFDKVKAGGQSSDVSAFEVQLKNKPMKAKELSAGKFSIENFAHLIKPPTETKDTKWKVFVTTKDALPNQEKRTEMVLVLDWNGDFKLDGGSVLPQEGELRITNLDKKTNEPLTGAKFKLSGNGKEITKTVIDAKGTLLFDKLAVGEYKITQTVAPKGYKLNSEEKTFTVVKDQTGEITIYNEKDDGTTPPPPSPPPSGDGSGGSGSGSGGGPGSVRPDSTTTITDNKTPLAEDPSIAKIEKLLSEGYMSGYPGNKFMPNKNMTRAEIAAMLDRLIDEQPTETKSFSDIKADAWYAKSLTKIASLGYIRPNGEKIQPEKPITRAEFAYIIAKLRKLEEGANMPKDVKPNHWAAKEIAACVKAGVISGYKDGSFKPEQPITRAEVVSMMSRAFNIQPKASTRADYIDVKKNHWAYNVIMASSQP